MIDTHAKLWNTLGLKVNSKWLKVYSTVSGKPSYKYVPENIYYNVIEPRLNNRVFSFAYADKNAYNFLFQDENIFPKTMLRKINGTIYDPSYNPVGNPDLETLLNSDEEYIVKPAAETGGGKCVELLKFDTNQNDFIFSKTGTPINLKGISQAYPENFIIQKKIKQHPFFSQFNPSSVNTIRIFTYRSFVTEEIIPLQAILRMGREGSIVDNQASGGISCGIDHEGKLNPFAVDKFGNKYDTVNSVSLNSVGKIPFLDEMKEYSKKLGSRMFYSRLNGFDFCTTVEGEVKLLEINTKNIEINFMQMSNGPLFREFTEEVINNCMKMKKVQSIHLKFD
jgi:hypothetical protein